MDNNALKLTLQDLNLAGREIPVPVNVFLEDGSYITIEKVLRVLPGKRLVAKAQWHKKPVLAKIFFQKGKPGSAAKKENRGYNAIKKVGIVTPERLSVIREKQAQLFLYDFISEGESLYNMLEKTTSPAEHSNLLRMVVLATVSLHENGLLQEDLHFDNFMYWLGELYVIDVASITSPENHQPLSQSTSIENLALLWAQLPPSEQSLAQAYFTLYCAKRNWLANESLRTQFDCAITTAWEKRKNHYLQKQFRECTENIRLKNFAEEIIFKRKFKSTGFEDLLKNPDMFLAKGEMLKDGNSATVVKIDIDNQPFVIKRYNNKNFLKAFTRLFKKSRAERCWYFAHLLGFIDLQTPAPVAVIVNRFGPFRLNSYFISEYHEGSTLQKVWSKNEPNLDIVESIVTIFMQLKANRIVHGDCKSTNFLVKGGDVCLIDLDSMQDKQDTGFKNDIQRFLKDWQQKPELLAYLKKQLKVE
ncbi:MAG: hypothetical protein KDI30_01510 [Pseudomonadales bacterium]|nr:hypothetical protein [Pseudomonadales bacterium]